jgi:hypothetical protein
MALDRALVPSTATARVILVICGLFRVPVVYLTHAFKRDINDRAAP